MLYCFWDDAGTCVCPTSICGHASTLPRSNILIKNSLAKRKTDSIHFMTFILQVKKFKCEGIWVDCLSFSPSVYKHRGMGGGGVRSDDSIILFSLTFSGLMKQEATYPHQREKREISVDFWEINWKLALLMNLFDTSTVCSRLILSRHLINEHNAKWKDFKNWHTNVVFDTVNNENMMNYFVFGVKKHFIFLGKSIYIHNFSSFFYFNISSRRT